MVTKCDHQFQGCQLKSPPVPVVCKGLAILRIQCPCCCKHDGGIQVGDDARNSSSSRDACLGPLVASLESGEHQGYLEGRKGRQGMEKVRLR